jgi:hypothetical protein
MRNFARPFRIVVAALAALWLCAVQPAKAGDGGADFGSLQAFITNKVCPFLGMNPCPQLPTLTQAVLQLAALENATQGIIRTTFSVSVGVNIEAGNPSRPPALNSLGGNFITGFPPQECSSTSPGAICSPVDLSKLNLLAFIASSATGSATPTQLYNDSANAFFYAVGGTSTAGATQPDTLYLFYDDLTRTSPFSAGQVAAKISLPLTVLNSDGTERPVLAVLQYQVPATGASCSASTVVGDFKGTGKPQTLSAAQIGVNCTAVFATSPVSPVSPSHAIFEVAVPLLLTGDRATCIPGSKSACTPPNTDPAYFYAEFDSPFFTYPYSPGLVQPFLSSEFGFMAAGTILGSKGVAIGVAPTAGPLGPPSTTTPAIYPLCASFPTGASGQALVPSVAAFYAIATDSEVLLSTPLAPVAPGIVCPF